MRVVLIPVKELAEAKTRLAPVLDAEGRRELALAMFHDVLEAALACEAIDGVAVVTRDATVSEQALEAGAEVMAEAGGLNEALTSASAKLAERGANRLVLLAADLPLASPQALASVVGSTDDVAIVPSIDGGTNVLVAAPAALDFSFGPGSARRHEEASTRAGLRVQRFNEPGLQLDVDGPDDLTRLQEAVAGGRPIGRHTQQTATTLGIVWETIRGKQRENRFGRIRGDYIEAVTSQVRRAAHREAGPAQAAVRGLSGAGAAPHAALAVRRDRDGRGPRAAYRRYGRGVARGPRGRRSARS